MKECNHLLSTITLYGTSQLRKRNGKGIISIESWDGEVVNEPRGGMRSLLTFVSEFHQTSLTHNFLYTPEEMTYVLRNVPTRNHSLLYLALHGKPESIQTGMYSEFNITLNELSTMMGKRFSGFGVHLASCAVMSSSEESIYDFMDKTGVLFISGYKKYVDFISSSIVDLALINNWMFARNYRRMFEKMYKSPIKQILSENGFKYYLP